MKDLGVTNVRCHWQNVLENGFVTSEFILKCPEEQRKAINEGQRVIPLEELKEIEFTEIADAVFLDLPSPEKVVKHANKVLKRGGRICSFSPCIEQIQETIKELSKQNYLEFRTVEIIEREMQSKKIPNENLLENIENKNNDVGVYVGNEDQKMHTGYLLFATKHKRLSS